MLNRMLVLLVISTALITGCNGKGPDPRPVNYTLYAGVHYDGHAGHAYIARIDTQADTVLDSFPVPMREVLKIVTSGDGRHLAASGGGRTYICNPTTGAEIADLIPGANIIFPSTDDGFLAAYRDSTVLYRIFPFGREEVFRVELTRGRQIPGTSLIIGVSARSSDLSPGYELSKLTIFDLDERREVDSLIIDPNAEGVGLQVFSFELSADGKRLYALVASEWAGGEIGATGHFLIGYDLTERRLMFASRVRVALGFCQVSPNGQEVWYTAAWETRIPSWPKYIFILDAFTGTPLDSISTIGFYPDTIPRAEHEALQPQDIRFLPDGEKAYVACGRTQKQPIMVIDTRTREVIDLIFDDFTLWIESIDIAPGP